MSDIKDDAEKTVEDIGSKLARERLIARQQAQSALNQESGWAEKNPIKFTAIILVLFLMIVVMLAKSCS